MVHELMTAANERMIPLYDCLATVILNGWLFVVVVVMVMGKLAHASVARVA